MSKQKTLHQAFRPCRDFIAASLPFLALAMYLYGWRPLIMTALGCFTALCCDLLNALLRRQRFDPSEISSYMFSVVLTLLLPASAPYYVVIVGSAAASLLGKHAFGGYGCYPFSPTAFGFAFVSVCWPKEVFGYPQPFSEIGLGWLSGAQLFDAPAASLKLGGVPYVETSDLILGNYPGPMGATFCLVALAVFFLLVEHRTMSGHVTLSYLLACALFAFAFPRITAGRLQSVMYEMLSGSIIFAGVLMAGEPSSAPRGRRAKVVYGAILGVTTMLFRYYGVYELGFCFALLLVSPLAGFFDRKLASPVARAIAEDGDELPEAADDAPESEKEDGQNG